MHIFLSSLNLKIKKNIYFLFLFYKNINLHYSNYILGTVIELGMNILENRAKLVLIRKAFKFGR